MLTYCQLGPGDQTTNVPWNLNQSSAGTIFHANAFENVVHKMLAVFFSDTNLLYHVNAVSFTVCNAVGMMSDD